MSYNSALTEALNELNGKSTRPQIIKKKIFESKEIKEDSNYKAKVHQAVEKEIKQYLTETLQDFKVITIEVDEYYEKLNEKGRLEIAKSDTLLYKEFEINGDEKVIIEAENTYNELCKKYNVTPTLRPLSHLAFDANLNRKELAKEGKPYYLVSMYMISYAGDIVPYDRYRLKDAAKKESVNEDYMHKDFHIQERDAREFDEWADVNEVVFYVPELKAGFNTKEDAIKAIDSVVAYEKSHKDDNLRKEIAFRYAQKEEAQKQFKELVEKTAQKILEVFGDFDITLEDIINILKDSKYKRAKDILAEFVFETKGKFDVNSISDIVNDFFWSANDLRKREHRYNTVTFNYDREAELGYNTDVELKEFPYYVVHYVGDAAYEPAEGGYYVDETKVDFSKGFKTLPDARKYAKKLADEYELEKVDDDLYRQEGKYVGDHEYVIVEKSKEYLSRSHRYHGYS